jgi:hypothetical protein
MRALGFIPRQRLKNIPPDLRVRHEYCFFLHDECVRALKEYEEANAHVVSIEFQSKITAEQFQKIAKDRDTIEALRATGYPNEAKRVILNHITMAMVSDCLHHIFEGLRCLEKRKFVVALNLLRKPLKDNLLYLAWMLGDEDDFYRVFTSGNLEDLTHRKLGNVRIDILSKAIGKTGIAAMFDPALLNELIYDRRSSEGFELLFQHAVHLITDSNIELRTSSENFNFIFKSPSEDDIYEMSYKWLPYILLFLSHVILGLFDRMKSMDDGARDGILIRSVYGYALIEDAEWPTILAELKGALSKSVRCANCRANLNVTRYNAIKIAITDSFQCTSCGKKNALLFSYIF